MNEDGYLYYFHDASRLAIKIGMSHRPWARLKTVARDTGTVLKVLALVPGGRREELAEHKRWKSIRLTGEWFAATPALTEYAASLGICETPLPHEEYVAQATEWARYLEEREAAKLGTTRQQVRGSVANRCRVTLGLLHNLSHSRASGVNTHDYYSLRDEFIAEKNRQLDQLQSEVTRLEREREEFEAVTAAIGSGEAHAILASLAKIRASLGLQGRASDEGRPTT